MVYRLHLIAVITSLTRSSSQSRKAKVDKKLLPVKMLRYTSNLIDLFLINTPSTDAAMWAQGGPLLPEVVREDVSAIVRVHERVQNVFMP